MASSDLLTAMLGTIRSIRTTKNQPIFYATILSTVVMTWPIPGALEHFQPL